MIGLWCACVLAAGCATAPPVTPVSSPQVPADPPYTQFRELTAAEKKIIASGVAKGLKDPDSARFRWARFPQTSETAVTYCAMVNAKNSYGGYTGFRSYIATVLVKNGRIVGAVLIGTEIGPDGNIVEEMCRKRGLFPLNAA